MCSGSEAGSYLRLVDFCITQLQAQGPSRTCNESKEEEEEEEEEERGTGKGAHRYVWRRIVLFELVLPPPTHVFTCMTIWPQPMARRFAGGGGATGGGDRPS